MTLSDFLTTCQAHSNGLHLGGLRALANRLRDDHGAHATARDVETLHDSLTAIAITAAAESPTYDAAWARGYSDGIAAFDKPMQPAEAAGTLAGIVQSLHRDLLANAA